jgi:uncharacterized RDD family membrane protein YckC
MTQSPDHPGEQEVPPGAAPPPPQSAPVPPGGTAPPPPPQQPYPSAPPIGEPYGGGGPPGITAELAGRWSRLLAAIIDGIIAGVISWLISIPLVGGSAMFDSGTAHMGHRLGANGISAVVAILYFTFQHGKWGQSVGKRALGIRVVRSTDGGPISYGTAAWRVVFTYLISLVTCGLGGLLDALWILWDGRKQALHDKVAKTYVVKADGPDPYAGT